MYLYKCIVVYSGGETMEQNYLKNCIKELVDECTDIELLYMIKGLFVI